jgi:hypothetical protein
LSAPPTITIEWLVGVAEVIDVAVNVFHVPFAKAVGAVADPSTVAVVCEVIPDAGIVFKITDGLMFNEVVVSEVHVIVCSDELPRVPATGAAFVDTEIDVMLLVPAATVRAAEAGATEDNTPRPKAATATSAMRLKVVFVDICFLSISRSREFPPVGFG